MEYKIFIKGLNHDGLHVIFLYRKASERRGEDAGI